MEYHQFLSLLIIYYFCRTVVVRMNNLKETNYAGKLTYSHQCEMKERIQQAKVLTMIHFVSHSDNSNGLIQQGRNKNYMLQFTMPWEGGEGEPKKCLPASWLRDRISLNEGGCKNFAVGWEGAIQFFFQHYPGTNYELGCVIIKFLFPRALLLPGCYQRFLGSVRVI